MIPDEPEKIKLLFQEFVAQSFFSWLANAKKSVE